MSCNVVYSTNLLIGKINAMRSGTGVSGPTVSKFFPAQHARQPSHLEYPLCTAPNRQVPDNSPINGYNRRPLSELASPYFVDWPDRLVPPKKKPGGKSTPAFMPTLPPGFAMTGAGKLTSGPADLREVASQYSVRFQVRPSLPARARCTRELNSSRSLSGSRPPVSHRASSLALGLRSGSEQGRLR